MKNVLFLAAEVAPYVAVGGLSQVTYHLPRALKRRGLDVRILTPRYGTSVIGKDEARSARLKVATESLVVPTGGEDADLVCRLLEYAPPDRRDAIIYFLENREYFELRANVFGYADDHTRFALMSKACLEWLLLQAAARQADRTVWFPDIIHCHDWHASYLIDMARRDPRYNEVLRDIPIVLSVHNFQYQGTKDFRFLRPEQQDDGRSPLAPLTTEALGAQNALLRGLRYADSIMTVSPTHAVEVLTPEYSYGLLNVLNSVSDRLGGIINGLDLEHFDPMTDKTLVRNFNSLTAFWGRRPNKLKLQREFSLPSDASAPLLGFVGRLAQQKGIDLLIEAIPHVIAEWPDAQFVILGGGEEKYRNSVNELHERYPRNVGVFLHSDFKLPRLMFAGCDLMLIPSAFEPGGIVALEAMRYGAVPLVRQTGGLCDTVCPFDAAKHAGNGFRFIERSPWSLYGKIVEALTVYRQDGLWRQLVRNAMLTRVTWDDAAKKYETWYRSTAKAKAKT